MFFPQSVNDISAAIESGLRVQRHVKAIGGGWSFTDAALPFTSQAAVDSFSLQKLGEATARDLSTMFRILGGDTTPQPIDTIPPTVDGELHTLTHYDQPSMTQVTQNFATPLFGPAGQVGLINLSMLASSLQQNFPNIASAPARAAMAAGTNFFHVEAGITISDLQVLLDHQSPRLALKATGGSPGATLAGTISTGTHGGEFTFPLLIDTVRAIHLVGPTGQQWWIEGVIPIADPVALQKTYPQLDAAHFIGGAWSGIPGLTAQNVLEALIVSMGTMGVIYSVVLEVFPQFGLQQKVVHLAGSAGATGWDAVLAATGDPSVQSKLRSNDPNANLAVLNVLLDGSKNGTGIPLGQNVYADLAINPFNQECWITNRQQTPSLPLDGNNPAAGFGDYFSALSKSLSEGETNTVFGSGSLARIFDFFDWDRDMGAFVVNQDWNAIGALVSFITGFLSPIAPALAALNVQAVLNAKTTKLNPFQREYLSTQFLADCLSGFLNAIQGTTNRTVSDRTDISYKVGAIGWPDGGIPGRALEIAMDPTTAFSFLQTQLFDDIFPNIMVNQVKPFIGYISIRICSSTRTLFGMQQFGMGRRPQVSVMTEIVGYRSPESDALFDAIQGRVLAANRLAPGSAMLHWGLENDQMMASDLLLTPLNRTFSGATTMTRIDAFKAIRKFFQGGFPFSPFDNNFTMRLGL